MTTIIICEGCDIEYVYEDGSGYFPDWKTDVVFYLHPFDCEDKSDQGLD